MFVFVWLILFVSSLVIGQSFVNVDDRIYYKEPKIPLRGFNFTIAGLQPVPAVSKKDFNQFSLVTATAVCQTVLINKGLSDIKLDGSLNFAIAQYDYTAETSQTGQMMLFERALYNKSTNQPLNPSIAQVDTFFGIDGLGNARINAAISGSSLMPYMTSGSFGSSGPIDDIIYFNKYVNETGFVVQAASNVSVVGATLNFLEFMNWTLVGTIYEDSLFGFSAQARIVNYQSENQTPYFTCQSIYNGITDVLLTSNGENFCSCIDSYDTVSVIVVFASLNNGYLIGDYLNNLCNNPNFTYVITNEDSYTPESIRTSNATALENSFLIRAFYNWDFQSFIQECAQAADEATTKYVLDTYQQYFNFYANCTLGISNADDLPVCTHNRTGNIAPCQCSQDTIDSGSIGISQLYFTVDAVTTIAQALSLLQNNCTYLNSQQSVYLPNVPEIDYCALTSITPPVINYAIRLVNFTGYTGNIYFPTNYQIRAVMEYFVYQLDESFDNSAYIGNFSINGGYYNLSAVSFPNGKVPTSAIVVANPSLSDATVAVFFGVSIFFLSCFALVFIYLLINHNNPYFKKKSSILTEIMCFGVFCHAMELLFLCFGVTDALCWFDAILSAIAYSLFIGALISKNYRLYRIFHNRRAVALRIRTSILILYVVAIAVYMLLIELCVFLDGYGVTLRVADGNPFYQYLVCSANSTTWQDIYEIWFNVSKLIFLLVASVLSFLTRKLSNVYEESKALGVLAYTHLMIFMLLTPLYYMLVDSTDSEIIRFVIQAEELTLLCLIALFVYFLPLCWHIRQHSQLRNE